MADLRLCRSCGVSKSIAEFYQHTNSTFYLDCKPCWREYVRQNREKNAEKYREHDFARVDCPKRKKARTEYQKTKVTPEMKKKYMARYNEKYPDKHTARNKMHAALKNGLLKRPSDCEKCGKTCSLHGHHEDYSKPFDVQWLCPVCHGLAHRKPRALTTATI